MKSLFSVFFAALFGLAACGPTAPLPSANAQAEDFFACQTDFLVEKAQNLGAIGARQMGGGFGGCTINLLQTNAVEPFLAEITAAYLAAFGLDLRAYPVRLTDGVGQV